MSGTGILMQLNPQLMGGSSEGMRTASVNWPVTAGAPIDYNVPVVKRKN